MRGRKKNAIGEDVVVLLAFRYANMTLEFDEMTDRSGETNVLYEWVFNLNTGVTTERLWGVPAGEFPVVRKNVLGRKFQFMYYATSGTAQDFPKLDGVAKLDMVSGALRRRAYGPGIFGGELSFVSGTSDREDDGFLTGFIHDEIRDVSSFIVLNAETLEQVTRVELPDRVPYGFHGTFVTRQELEGSL